MEMLTGIVIVSTGVKLVIDKLRKWLPRLDGDLVNLGALGLGYAATYLPDVVTLDSGSWTERMSAAIFITGTSALFAQATKKTEPMGV
jgi:hypothetical protein